MKLVRFILVIPILIMLLAACEEEQTTGAEKVRWDREICARCAMAVSDRKYSAQVRGGRKDKRPKVYKFDDVGCAVIWLDKQNWKDDERTEIWVNDHRDGKWINAQTAWYVKMKNTPMDYGMGAQTDNAEGALNYEQAREHIYKVEQRFNPHTGLPVDIREIESEKSELKKESGVKASDVKASDAKDTGKKAEEQNKK